MEILSKTGKLDFAAKKLIVSDLDGTLVHSKLPLDSEMAGLMLSVLEYKRIAVIGGGRAELFFKQLLNILPKDRVLSNLYLFPTNGAIFYKYNADKDEWVKIYEDSLSAEEKAEIFSAFEHVISMFDFAKPKQLFSEQIEDRITQVTYSALGQNAPLELKQVWDPDTSKRSLMKSELEKLLPDFDVRIGGTTSIDITKKGINKAYGIRMISKHLGYSIDEMFFIGDAIFEGRNDYEATLTGIDCVRVNSIDETKQLFKDIIRLSKNQAQDKNQIV
jgi:phosphomannomutase